jgi:hypothetical protein
MSKWSKIMSFFQRILNLFSGKPGSGGKRNLPIYLLSRRCNEPLAGEVDIYNELSQSEEDEGAYFTRKVLHTSGENRCFDQVEVQIWFDRNKQVVQHEVHGGRWLTAEEYEAEVERQAREKAEAEAAALAAQNDENYPGS